MCVWGTFLFPADSEMDFKVACLFFFLCRQFKTILLEALFDSRSLSCMYSWTAGKGKKIDLLLILNLFCLFAQVGMALILLSSLLSCISTKCTDLFC